MSEPKISVSIMREKMLFSREIYTTGKNFTLPPAVTGVTKITSAAKYIFCHLLVDCCSNYRSTKKQLGPTTWVLLGDHLVANLVITWWSLDDHLGTTLRLLNG